MNEFKEELVGLLSKLNALNVLESDVELIQKELSGAIEGCESVIRDANEATNFDQIKSAKEDINDWIYSESDPMDRVESDFEDSDARELVRDFQGDMSREAISQIVRREEQIFEV